jgi:membrane protein DedA with SNARE-associated domain
MQANASGVVMLPSNSNRAALIYFVQQLAANSTSKSSSRLLPWVMNLGGVGLFGIAIIDSSIIPIQLPGSTDLLLLLLTAYRSSSIALTVSFVAWAFAGSVLGGYFAWAAGQKGGEAAIEKLGRGRFVKRATAWAKRNGVLSVGIVALLPPPVPLLPVVVAAGALGLTRGRFLASYGSARLLRYSFIGWLGYTYGRRVVSLWQTNLKPWMTPILTLYVAMVVLVAAYGLWKYFKERNKRN